MGIKYRNSDLDKLQRTVDNFNAKVRRAAARGVEGLPETVRIKDIRQDITGRADFNRTVNALQRFSRKGAEKAVTLESGLKISKWEKAEFNRLNAIAYNKAAHRATKFGELEVTSQGRKQGYKLNEMGSARMNDLKATKRNIQKIKSRADLKEAKAAIKNKVKTGYYAKRDALMVQNYIKGLETVFGKRSAALIQKIKDMPVQAAVRMMYQDQEGSISFVYDPVQLEAKYNAIMSVWNAQDDPNTTPDRYQDFIAEDGDPDEEDYFTI